MKKKFILILTLLFILFIFTGPAVYAVLDAGIEIDNPNLDKDEDGNTISESDNFKSAKSALPDIERIYDPDKNSYKYITYYKDQFSLDFEESWFGLDSDEIYNSNANVMFSIQQSIVETVIFLVDKVYNFKVYKLFKDLVKNTVSNMYSSNINILISIMLALLGFYFAYKIVLNQKSEFWSTLLKTILILTVGLLFFNKPNLILSKLDSVMNNISNEILDMKDTFSTSNSESDGDGSTELANFMWEQYILKPWQFLEFGDMEIAEEHTDEILSMAPGSDARVDRLNQIFEKENVDTFNMATERLSFICMYYIPLTINLLMISFISVLILGYQFLAIVVFLLGIFVMVLALLPNGTNLLKMWISRLFGFSAMKVFLTFLFTILISVNEILFDNVENEGWLAIISIQVLFYIMVFLKRNSLLSMFVSLQSELTNPYMALNRLRTIKDLPYMQAYNGNYRNGNTQKSPPDNYNTYQSFYKNIYGRRYYINNKSKSPKDKSTGLSKLEKHMKSRQVPSNKISRIKKNNPQNAGYDKAVENKSIKPSNTNEQERNKNKIKNIKTGNPTSNTNVTDAGPGNNMKKTSNEETNSFDVKKHINSLKKPPVKSLKKPTEYKKYKKPAPRRDKKDD